MKASKELVLSRVTTSAPEACWEWTGHRYLGYGYVSVTGGSRRAHRVAYELWIGPIPEGLVLDHLCRNKACVNPAHLEAVTQQENLRRGQVPTYWNAEKTHCKRGHPFSGNNLYIRPDGSRECRACSRMRWYSRPKRSKSRRIAEQSDPPHQS